MIAHTELIQTEKETKIQKYLFHQLQVIINSININFWLRHSQR